MSSFSVHSKLPLDVVVEILGHLTDDIPTLRACSLVSKSCVPWCRKHLFFDVFFSASSFSRWRKAFPLPEHSPAHFVRALHLLPIPESNTASHLAKHILCFSKIEELYLEPAKPSLLATLPRILPTVRYLRIKDKEIPLDQIHMILARLPSLDSLMLAGIFPKMDFPFGDAPRGDFRGALRLHGDLARGDVFNMLMNIPTGLHFTKLDIVRVDGKYFQDALRLVEACKHSLQKLRFIPEGTCYADRTFDFSTFASLEILKFDASWNKGDNHWEVPALETLNPTMCPRLRKLQVVHVRTWSNRSEPPKGLHHQLTRIRDAFGVISITFGSGRWEDDF